MRINIQNLSLLQEESLDTGDEALLNISVAINLYEVHSYRIQLLLYTIHCKHQGLILSNAFHCNLLFTPC